MSDIEIIVPGNWDGVDLLVGNKLRLHGVAYDDEGKLFGMEVIFPLPEPENRWQVKHRCRVTDKLILMDA